VLALDGDLKQLEILSSSEFEYFRSKIFELAGISMSDSKIDLVRTRLRSRIISLGFSSFKAYQNYLKGLSENDPEWQAFINVMTTNKTDWFREPEHFHFLVKEFLPKWLSLGKKHLRVWCAASSTGEEPYTLALVLAEVLQNTQITFEIIASDIDTKVLEVAKNGVYHVDRLYQIPQDYQKSFIAKGTGEISSWFRLKKDLKSKVSFKQVNLIASDYPLNSKFDIVFCRNVLIYFDNQTIENVIQNIYRYCEEDAVLVIGHSESLQNIKSQWKYMRPSIYLKGRKF